MIKSNAIPPTRENNIHIEKINIEISHELVKILNTDILLQSALGSSQNSISIEEFINYNSNWCKTRNAEIFGILLNSLPIGMISLSHQNLDEHKAQIGYWIRSEYWGNSYTSLAFSQLLKYAKNKGIEHLSATIDKKNIASKKIWINNGAYANLVNDKFSVYLKLK